MTLQQIWQLWDRFWFEPKSTLPVCVFRILIAFLVLESELLNSAHWLDWYGVRGVFSLESCQQYFGAPCINFFVLLPRNDLTAYAILIILLVSATCLMLGLFTRAACIITFLLVTTLAHRDPLILNGGDSVLRCCLFWLMFAPSGELLSLDRVLKEKRGITVDDDPQLSMWALRMLQLQIVAVYCQCFWSKLFGLTWLDGTAVYYVLHEVEYLRFPLPVSIDSVWVSKIFTWGTLVVEFALWALIWVKELRYYILAAGLVLHLGLEYTMNLPVFEQMMMCSYVLFVDPADIRRFLRAVAQYIPLGKPSLPAA